MVVEIGAVYGNTVDASAAKETMLTLGAGFAARTVFQGIISLLPGIKNVLGPPYAAAATYALGAAAKQYFVSGQTPTESMIRSAAAEALRL